MRGKTILLNAAGGQFLLADGSATLPSLTFASQTNMGIYKGGASDLRITVNGGDVIKFTALDMIPTTDNSLSFGSASLRAANLNTKAITIGQSLSNPTMGEVTLSGASATAIAYTTALSAGARIFLSKVLGRGTQGSVYVTSSTNGVSFTVQSTSTTDTSVVAYWIVPVS